MVHLTHMPHVITVEHNLLGGRHPRVRRMVEMRASNTSYGSAANNNEGQSLPRAMGRVSNMELSSLVLRFDIQVHRVFYPWRRVRQAA